MAKQILGDINNDGKIDIIDACVCLSASAEKISLDTEETTRADVDKDGDVSVVDARMLLQHISGKTIIDGVIE